MCTRKALDVVKLPHRFFFVCKYCVLLSFSPILFVYFSSFKFFYVYIFLNRSVSYCYQFYRVQYFIISSLFIKGNGERSSFLNVTCEFKKILMVNVSNHLRLLHQDCEYNHSQMNADPCIMYSYTSVYI